MPVEAGCIPTRHTPVMVKVDLIIKQYTVVTLSTNRSRPVTIVQFQTKVGAPVDRSTGLGRPGWVAPTVLSIQSGF